MAVRVRQAGLMACAALMLVQCSGADDMPAPDAASRDMSPAAEELDALALESGALPDSAALDPAGRYGRRYEGGSDSLCLVPEEAARGRYRFGVESRIGADEYCRGAGRARLSAGKMLLRFEGAGRDCLIVARYEGDRVEMPGGLDLRCAALCSSRGSFAGVSFPRVDRSAEAARAMQDSRGRPLCR
ncbi:hypothetical protein [Sphingobium lignivorans]|uniref:Lipoprotein n=1 Tax=Sphingobium lignivorans TaxID=2735886 RepID=A0ABR6NDM0_9SPHN|nr:hypothetical protein [Sphingobium lignivorans]MBB5985365.1 hypothetical protein [Sphingobium lignivorans]